MRALSGLLALISMTAGCRPSDPIDRPSTPTRIVIVDAGSSGTRVHVYEDRRGELVDLTPECDFGPPLAVEGPDAVLGPWRSCRVAELTDERTPVRVFATGGMRTLAESDPTRAAQIHVEVVDAVRELGHADVESRTIDGVEEARFAWIAVNLVHGSLGDATVGILELGGSSTQIAFVPDDPAAATEVVALDGHRYPLFAVSYLHCGAKEARRDLATASCDGAGDFAACTATISTSLRSPSARCPAASEPRPPMVGERFVLIDNFASLVRNLGAVQPDGAVDLDQLWIAAASECTSAAPGHGKTCFRASLTRSLLELYGLSNSADLMLLEQAPVWALGAAHLERATLLRL
jgi:hypothetical protein